MNVSATSATTEPTASKKPQLKQLRELTGKVVGQVFFGPLLQSMRESKLRGEYGHGGRGEEVFAAQMHSILAERAGVSINNGIGDALYRQLAGQQRRMTG